MFIRVSGIVLGAALSISAPAFGAGAEDVVAAMIAEGAPPAQAECIVGKLGDDAERLFTADDSDLNDEDMQKLESALMDCSDVDGGE